MIIIQKWKKWHKENLLKAHEIPNKQVRGISWINISQAGKEEIWGINIRE